MRRRRPTEKIEAFEMDLADDLDTLAQMASRWAADNRMALGEAAPDVPAELFNRQRDNWRGLIAIADRAGGEWPILARKAARALALGSDNDSLREMLLADIRSIFQARGAERLPSTTICEDLAEMEDRPWPEWGKTGKPISTRQLARQLKPFAISPSARREGAAVFKGYRRDTFDDAYAEAL